LLKAHNEHESNARKSALDQLTVLLHDLDLEPYTRWSEAQSAINKDDQFQGDKIFRSLSKIDILKAFENHIKSLERTFNDSRQKQKSQKSRQERQNRDGFIALLNQLRSAGKIKPNTKWMDIHPLIKDDARYVAILGQSGSTPLDLFWDIIEEEDRNLRNKRNDALDVLEEKRYELTPKTSFEDFASIMSSDRRTSSLSDDTLRLIFTRLREKVLRRSEDDRHAQRRAVDALRSRIKHLDPPISSSDSFDKVRPRLENLPEFRALDSDDLRIQAFDKVIRRLKERDSEDRDSRRARDSPRRGDHHRDRDHDSRRIDSHRRHRSRSPAETDAYAADRKKAQADREKQYRKGSFGLSPPPSATASRRDTTDRYVPSDRPRSRDRTSARPSAAFSRADPREAAAAAELDYGDSSAARAIASTRRRREDSDEDGRESKRVRSERGTSEPKTEDKDKDVEYKSGSEEGEIEED